MRGVIRNLRLGITLREINRLSDLINDDPLGLGTNCLVKYFTPGSSVSIVNFEQANVGSGSCADSGFDYGLDSIRRHKKQL